MDRLRSLDPHVVGCAGFCPRCGREHGLPLGDAPALCRELMAALERHGRIDFESPRPDPRLSTKYLYGPARGQMFGVMAYVDRDGAPGSAKAFSGQYNSVWLADGWVAPVGDIAEADRITVDVEREIKRLGGLMETLAPDSAERRELGARRRGLSRNLMREIHGLYRLANFRSQTLPMAEAFYGKTGMPTGAGDCCAPKLLNHAALNGLTPTGLAEFYWGRENRSNTRRQGEFYPACADKCRPILGFMLCGLTMR